MGRILVSGLMNIETTLQVESFPVEVGSDRYPFFGINSSVSGVGFNLAKALTVLGNQVELLSMVGPDLMGEQAVAALRAAGISTDHVLPQLPATPQSVILFDRAGRRQITSI